MLLIKEIIMIKHCVFLNASNFVYLVLSDLVLFSFRYARCFVPTLMAILSTPEVLNAKHNSNWYSKLSARLFGASSRRRVYFPVERSNE